MRFEQLAIEYEAGRARELVLRNIGCRSIGQSLCFRFIGQAPVEIGPAVATGFHYLVEIEVAGDRLEPRRIRAELPARTLRLCRIARLVRRPRATDWIRVTFLLVSAFLPMMWRNSEISNIPDPSKSSTETSLRASFMESRIPRY